MTKTTVNYKGIEFELEGIYTEGEERTYYCPGSNSEFELYNALVNGIDILEILLESQIEDLTDLAIEQIEE